MWNGRKMDPKRCKGDPTSRKMTLHMERVQKGPKTGAKKTKPLLNPKPFFPTCEFHGS